MVFLIFPIHLFENIDPIIQSNEKEILLIEDPIYFKDWNRKLQFNKKKLLFHRATMKMYYNFLKSNLLIKINKIKINYIDWNLINSKEKWENILNKFNNIICYDPVDNLLNKRLLKLSITKLVYLDSPLFLTTKNELNNFINIQKHKKIKRIFNQTTFYLWQRERLDILMNNGKPEGNKLTYDIYNRKALPKTIDIPSLPEFPKNKYIKEAIKYINRWWPDNYGNCNNFLFPISFDESYLWFENFLKERFYYFGEYQDAITKRTNPILFHSGISAMLNVGLLRPEWVIERSISWWKKGRVELSSLEGFIRQIIGWREFCRLAYLYNYNEMVSGNFFNADKNIDSRWYTGSIGILPLDNTIKKAFDTSYLHHIERLMIMTNFMCLYGLKPDDCYKWFMEFSIDSYDWVMVYNVYSMGLYADGGITTSKPYISSSNYIIKMSDYSKNDEWVKIWNSFYWIFINNNKDKIKKMGRIAFQINYLEKKSNKEIKEMNEIVLHFTKNINSIEKDK